MVGEGEKLGEMDLCCFFGYKGGGGYEFEVSTMFIRFSWVGWGTGTVYESGCVKKLLLFLGAGRGFFFIWKPLVDVLFMRVELLWCSGWVELGANGF